MRTRASPTRRVLCKVRACGTKIEENLADRREEQRQGPKEQRQVQKSRSKINNKSNCKGRGPECPRHTYLSGVASPVGDFSQTFSAGMFEEPDLMARVFELVDIGPNLGLPGSFVDRGFSAAGAARVEDHPRTHWGLHVLQLEENAADFFDLFVGTENVFVAQKVSKAEFARLGFCFFAGVEWPVFGSQLLSRVASHPENVFWGHNYLSLGRKLMRTCMAMRNIQIRE